MIKIYVCGYNIESLIHNALRSLYAQTVLDWDCQVVIDLSEDATYDVAKTFQSDKLHVHYNTERKGQLYNARLAVEMMKPNDDDIIICLDGDDALYHNKVFETVLKCYNDDPNLLLTYGSYIIHPTKHTPVTPYSKKEIENVRISPPFRASHLRTMKHVVWKNIKDIDLKDSSGEYLMQATDVALMYPAIEMAGYDRIKYISVVLYIYNTIRPTFYKPGKLQDNMNFIRSKTPYTRLEI